MTGALKYEWDWTKDLAGYDDQITLCADQLDRAKYAEFLTNYLVGYTESSYVMNLNAEWGAGKTYFLQRWYQTIKEHHPAAYVDAWKNDFSDDPLLTVIAGISASLKSYPNTAAYKNRKAVLKTGGRFLKKAGPAFLNALMKHYTGSDSESFKLENFGDFAEKALDASLDDHNEKAKDMAGFKTAISNWVNEAVGSEANGVPSKPMFFFIDELDRCRPTYAIELLETVKHLFDIPGLVFVVATNTDQLQHSIKAVYGSEFDAQRYLYRFFNRSFTLKKPNIEQFILVQDGFVGNSGLGQTLLSTCYGKVTVRDVETVANNLTAIAEFFEFDLRTTSQWLDQLRAIFPIAESQNIKNYFWIALAIISAIYIYKKDYYQSIFLKKPKVAWGARKDIAEIKEDFSDRSANKKGLIKFSVRADHLGTTTHDRGFFDGTRTISFEVFVHSIFVNVVNYFSEELLTNTEMATKAAVTFTKGGGDTWKVSPFCVNLAMHYCASQKGATKNGYLDLTELASDLE
jgi:hypothetical protein